MENGTALGRLPTLDEVANTAFFKASDQASAMTGTIRQPDLRLDHGFNVVR